MFNEKTQDICCQFHVYNYLAERAVLTRLIGSTSTGALSAGHVSFNQQDDAS